MRERQRRRPPTVDDGKVVGIVTLGDSRLEDGIAELAQGAMPQRLSHH